MGQGICIQRRIYWYVCLIFKHVGMGTDYRRIPWLSYHSYSQVFDRFDLYELVQIQMTHVPEPPMLWCCGYNSRMAFIFSNDRRHQNIIFTIVIRNGIINYQLWSQSNIARFRIVFCFYLSPTPKSFPESIMRIGTRGTWHTQYSNIFGQDYVW